VERTLIDELWGGIPALAALIPAIIAIHVVCRRPGLRRLRLALSLLALAASLIVFRRLAPTVAAPVASYLWLVTTFAGIYFLFKLADVLLLDIFLVRRGQRPPPGIFRDIISTIFAGVVLVMLLQAGLGVHVAALVVTSAAVSIFLGLALQQTISDLFAGLALMIERPFAPGDWVKIGQQVGRIQEVSWRAVKIQLLRIEDYLTIPNSVAAKAEIVNMSAPTRLHGHTIEVGAAYRHAPGQVVRALTGAAARVSGVQPAPAPCAELIGFADSAMSYRLTFWINDYSRIDEIASEVRAQVWYGFQREGIEIPYPTMHNYTRSLVEAEGARRHTQVARLATLLARVDFLSALRPDDLNRLAETAEIRLFGAGSVVARRGESGDSLFIVASGRLEVVDEPSDGRPARAVGTRDVGDYVGEMSLLTGAPRPATVRALEDTELAVLTREVLRPILVADPTAAERLSKTLAVHTAARQEAVQRMATESQPRAVEYQTRTLLGNIQRFFKLMDAAD
jgi:small-conductance mechanosensitive channel/CRP-like cAMP-binding protein